MKTEFILATLATVLLAGVLFNFESSTRSSSLVEFENFQISHGRSYTEQERIYRFNVFSENLKTIEEHNSDKAQTYTLGITQFADMTSDQFISVVLMKDLSDHLYKYTERQGLVGKMAPSEIDWRQQDVLTSIKNQGQCGSCWAFSTTGVLESNIAVSTGKLNNFSQQQLVDCCGDKGYQCLGCNGAWPEWALNYINNAGIVQQKQYAYTAKKGSCQDTPTAQKFLNSAKPWTMINRGDTESVKTALASSGPISICVDASRWSLYRSGVFSNCGTTTLNHAVLVVGYQSDNVWIVRNSWGTSWGEQGYIRLSPGNTCGLAEHAVIPNLA